MAKKSKRQRRSESPLTLLWRSDIGKRLVGLLGIGAIVGVAIAVLAAAGLFGNQGGGTTQSGVPIEDALVFDPPPPPGVTDFDVGTSVDKVAKDFEVSRIEDGSRVRLSDFRGRPVLVNFWATWCIPCRVEMPDLQELQDRHPELVIIGIDRPEPVGRATNYLADLERLDGGKGIDFTVNALDPADAVYREYNPFFAIQPNIMPISALIDANGVVTFVQIGPWRLPQMEEAFALTLASAPVGTTESAGS